MKIQRYVKETVGMVLLIIYMGSAMTVQAKEYEDVPPEHWAYSAINRLVTGGYLKRESDFFEPDAFATRQEASEVIATLIDRDVPTIPLAFKDVTDKMPHYEAVKRLTAIGALQNTTHFNGDKYLRRSHVAKMVAIANEMEYDTPHCLTYADVTKNTWSYNYIGALASADIMSGVSLQHFYPERYVTRAQLAVIIERAIDYKEHVDYRAVYDYLNKIMLPTVNYSREWAIEIANLTNDYRAQQNLPPLRYDRSLEQIAIVKANDMIQNNYFEHYSPSYGQPWDMATIFDYQFVGFGENIARHFKTPKHTVLGWINSPGHRKNMLNAHYTRIGVAIEQDADGNFYWVQHFAGR